MALRKLSWAATTSALLLASACSDQNQPAAPDSQPDAAIRSVGQGAVDNPNALARGVSGFGGFFYDAAGVPVIYLKDAGQRGNAERALAPYLQTQGVPSAKIQVRPGKFTWEEL